MSTADLPENDFVGTPIIVPTSSGVEDASDLIGDDTGDGT
jgi:hypothetical protein